MRGGMKHMNHMDPHGPPNWSGNERCTSDQGLERCCGDCDPLAPLDWISGFLNKLKRKNTTGYTWNGLSPHQKPD